MASSYKATASALPVNGLPCSSMEDSFANRVGSCDARASRYRERQLSSAFSQLEHLVFLAGVGPVLELDDAEVLEPLTQPSLLTLAGAGVEQAELLAVRDDLREQHLLEDLPLRAHHDERHRFLRVDAELVPHLLHEEAVAHADCGLEGELLPLAQLRRRQLAVVLLQRENAERHVTRLVGHHVAQQLLEERLRRELVDEPEGSERESLDHDLHAEVRHVPAAVLDDVVE